MPRRTRHSNLEERQTPSKQATTMVNLDADKHESGDEVSQTQDLKWMKFSMGFLSPDLKKRFDTIDLANRNIIPGKPIVGKLLSQCGVLKLFSDVGLEAFVMDLPKAYYPDLVREFYANLHEDKFGNCVSAVRDKKLWLNLPILSLILKIDTMSELKFFTAKGFVALPEFPPTEQLKTLLGSVDVTDLTTPTTSQVTPIAHLLFLICRNNICPRVSNRSNFTCQDVCVVAMLMSGKGFDAAHLILQNMLSILGQTKSGLPFGLLLTRVFEFFKIDVKGADKVIAKECIDVKNLASSNLQIENGELIRIMPTPPPPEKLPPLSLKHASDGSPADIAQMFKSLQDDNTMLISRMRMLAGEAAGLKSDFLGFVSEFKKLHEEFRLLRAMLVGVIGSTSSYGLAVLATAATKDGTPADAPTDDGKASPSLG